MGISSLLRIQHTLAVRGGYVLENRRPHGKYGVRGTKETRNIILNMYIIRYSLLGVFYASAYAKTPYGSVHVCLLRLS
jgi:hypothetical protein